MRQEEDMSNEDAALFLAGAMEYLGPDLAAIMKPKKGA